jgi:hypothetical protein
LLAPRPVGKALRLDMAGNPQAAYLARVLAVRDVVLACGAYVTDGEVRRQWLLAGLVCDSADTLAGIAAERTDGKLAAVESRRLYRSARESGGWYRAEFAAELSQLGLPI